MKKVVIRLFTGIVYLYGCLIYDKKYLTGKFFNRNILSPGWFWIIRYSFTQKILRFNAKVPFPVPPYVFFGNPRNIIFDNDYMDNFHNVGCYYQAIGEKITIGSNTMIAPNCGFITANHDLKDISKSAVGKAIHIGNNCWIGMNSMILPGVTLGDHTIVGAGAIVTKSFPEGNCVIAGNPAKKLKNL